MSDDEPTKPPPATGPAAADPSSLKGLTEALGFEPAEPGHDPLLGRNIGGVTIVRLIAEGGMGRVYEARQEKPGRTVAVKVIRPGFVSSEAARRFSLETEILGRLQHPHIAQIHSAGMCDVVGSKVPFFVMEFIPDALPITRYAAAKGLATKERLALFRKACEAVAHGHHNGVIHRDLKPGNILVDRNGTPKVIDFGVARCVDAKPEQMTALTDMGQLIGTLQYMSPEQIAADPSGVDVRSDVYALGVILYELLTGRRPYEISRKQIFEALRVVHETKPPAPSSLNRDVQPDLELIAGRCLHKNQARRFADAAELASALERHLGGGRAPTGEPGAASVDDVFAGDAHAAWRRRAFVAAVVGTGILAAAATALWQWRAPAHAPRERVWNFAGSGDLRRNFDVGGVAEPVPEGGVRLGNGIASSAIATKTVWEPPIRVEYDVVAGPDRAYDIFPGLFVDAVNTRSGIQYLFGDNGNTRSFVLIFGRDLEVAHEPIEAGRLYRIVVEVGADRRLTITRDDERVYEGTLPPDVELRGPVQCGGGLGDVTYKRLRIGHDVRVAPRPTEIVPGAIELSGLGDSARLQGDMPVDWMKPGVFAEIRGAGQASFPRLPVSDYVLDIDVEFRNHRGRISFLSGEPGSGTDMPLGSLWPQDDEQKRVPCRLFRKQPWGVNWGGEVHFNTNERLTLKLLVLDDEKALVWNGRPVLRSTGNAADFCLSLYTTPATDATIHRLVCRKPSLADAAEAGLAIPKRVLACDAAASADRLAAERASITEGEPHEGRDFASSDRELVMRWIEPGEFIMGDAKAPFPQVGAGQEKVRISRGYWLGAYEVSQGQWEAIMPSNPSRITGSPYLPVNNVTWSEACNFCAKLTALERQTGRCPEGYEYRLPTEAEWEWACRAGMDQAFTIPEKKRPVRDRYQSLVEVGATPANPWGLHEMLGNTPEWCLDAWRDYTGDTTTVVVDRLPGRGAAPGPFVVRGGGVWHDESAATSFARTKRHDLPGGFRGFRVALAPAAATLGRDPVEETDRP